MALYVLITGNFTDAHLNRLHNAVPTVKVLQVRTRTLDDVPAEWKAQAEVLYTFSALPQTPEEMPALRWIQLHSAGADHLPDWLRHRQDIRITTASGIHAVPMAEYTFMVMLALIRRLPRMLAYQQRHEWPSNRWDLFADGELRGSTLGVVGYGSIGREIGRLAKAFGMRLLAMRRHGSRREDTGYVVPGTGDPEGTLPDGWYTPDQKLDMLAACDIVVNVLPLTPDTRHFFDAQAFAAMKPSAYFINIGRGATVDEHALISALQQGHLAGAALDVFAEEPLPPDSPLWDMENVIISPHISAFSTRYDDRAIELFIANLQRYLKGAPLFNVYNPQLQY